MYVGHRSAYRVELFLLVGRRESGKARPVKATFHLVDQRSRRRERFDLYADRWPTDNPSTPSRLVRATTTSSMTGRKYRLLPGTERRSARLSKTHRLDDKSRLGAGAPFAAKQAMPTPYVARASTGGMYRIAGSPKLSRQNAPTRAAVNHA